MEATISPVPANAAMRARFPVTPAPVPVTDWDNDEVSPVLKWAGGKTWLVPKLREMHAPYRERRFVDMFAGGLSVTIGLAPLFALVNDVNPHVMNLYRWLRVGFAAPGFSLDMVPLVNDSDIYYRNRNRFNELIAAGKWNTPEAALLFWYLNRTGYNGLCRFNRDGFYNVPKGSYKKIDYAGMMERFAAYQTSMQRYQFLCRDFRRVPIKPRDFVYADPPYDSEPKKGQRQGSGFVGYAAGGFSWDDQVRLATWLGMHDGPVVASNAATDRIVELYESKGFHIEYVDAPRRISCKGDRTPVREILAMKGL